MAEGTRGALPTTYFLLALLLAWAAHALLPLTTVIPGSWRFLGVLPIAGGVVVMVAADQQFKRVKTAISPFDAPSTLVTDGLFVFSRNPMYLGMVLVLLGEAVALGTLTAFAFPFLQAWVFTKRFIEAEEEALRQLFGEEYEAYRRRVRRWI